MKPVAPKESEEHLALRGAAPDASTELALRRFLWEINAHWELISLPVVCQNVSEMLSQIVNVWKSDLRQFGFEDWPGILDWIHNNEIQLAKTIGANFAAQFSGQGTHPLMGDGVTRHSVYATLCNSHVGPTDRAKTRYRLLQTHLLVAKVAVMRRHTAMEQYESYAGTQGLLVRRANPYAAALGIRDMSEGGSPHLFEELPVELPPIEFFSALREVVPSIGKDIRHYNRLINFLEKGFNLREQEQRPWHSHLGDSASRPRIYGGSTSWVPTQRSDTALEDPGDSSRHRQGSHSTATRSRHNAAEAEEQLDVDDCPDEDEEDEEVDRTCFDDDAYQREPGSFQEVSAAQAMHVQMANQLFPWAYGELSISEIKPLMRLCLQHHSSDNRGSGAESISPDKLEVLALAEVMLWTSSSIERAQRLKVLDAGTSGRYADLSLRLKTIDNVPRWRIRAPLPEYRQPQSSVPERMNRIQFEFLELPDVGDGSFLVRKLLQLRSTDTETSHRPSSSWMATRVFTHKASWYRRRLRELLPTATRVTEGRLAKFLFTRILMESGGDLSATAITTGTAIQIAKVKLFYACPLVSRLQQLYVRVATRVRSELCGALEQQTSPPVDSQFDSRAVYIGSRHCPTLNAVQEAVIKLKRELKSTSPTFELERYHNLFSLYTLLMFFYTTGVRGISTPYINPLDIDPNLRLGVLTDKDSGVGYKSRLVRLTPTLAKQMDCYKNFISRSPLVYRMSDAPCFFLKPNLQPVEVRPRTLAPILKDFLPFPVNIHRRFISSELLDAGCPPEVVSAWMGHWHRGEEPWGKFSSFAYGEYCRALEYFLDPLLARLGFCAPCRDALVRPEL